MAAIKGPRLYGNWAGSGGAWAGLVAGDAAKLCVAGDIHLHLARQVWHLATSTFVSRGRRGTYGTGLALVARLVSRETSRGRRGTW